MEFLFSPRNVKHGYIDYVGCWFLKAAEYGTRTNSEFAFVTTNSLCQGHQVALLWPQIFQTGHHISFAYTSFKWANLASHNAGVTVAVIGLAVVSRKQRRIFTVSTDGGQLSKEVPNINAYLVGGPNLFVNKRAAPLGGLASMDLGTCPTTGATCSSNLRKLPT